MAETTTAIAQFSVAGGLWQESADNMRIVEGRGRFIARSRDCLYIMMEPLGSFNDPDAVCRRIGDCLEDTYFGNRGSITARLWAALKAANRELYEENSESPPNERGILGVTCALVRGADIYLIQAGPALAYIVRQGAVERFPAVSTWLYKRPSEAMEASPSSGALTDALGWRRDVEPDLYHGRIDEGDLIALTNTPLVRIATDDQIVAALSEKQADLVRHNLERLAGRHTLSGIIIEVLGEGAGPAELRAPRAAGAARDSRLDLVGPAPGEAAAEEEEEAWEAEDVAEEGAWDEAQEEEPEPEVRIDPTWSPRPAAPRRVPPAGPSAWSRLSGAAGAALRTLLPETAHQPRSAPRKRAARRGLALTIVLALAAVAIVVASAILIDRHLKQRAFERELAALVAQARAQLAASDAGSPDAQRVALAAAWDLADQLEAKQPGIPLAAAMQITITQRLDAINQVARIGYVGLVKDFAQDVRPSSPDRLLVRGRDLYALDRDSTQLNRYTLDASGEGLQTDIAQSMLAGVSATGSAVRVIDMACPQDSSNAQQPYLVALTADGTMLEGLAQARELASKPVEGGRNLANARAIATYGEAPSLLLYVLDPAANLIRKYIATGGMYSDEPADYPASGQVLDLSQAVDLAIDGNIYILLADGTVLKLLQGALTDFRSEGLDKPLSNAVALAVWPEGDMEQGVIYVADAGNQRIVQFDKKGAFLRQFLPAAGQPALDDLRDLAVVEEGGTTRLYVLNGDKLMTLVVP